MKNYICINGKKSELTQEQLKQLGIVKDKISMSDDGKIVTIGDYEFIVLKHDKTQGTVELLLKDFLCSEKFGDTNDYRTSHIRKVVEKFGDKIADIVGEENLVEHNVDLTTVDGDKEFGAIKAKMSLLTFDKFRDCFDVLNLFKPDKWWWLISAWATKKHDVEILVSCVSMDGYVYCDICSNHVGVRPFCILKSNIFVSKGE